MAIAAGHELEPVSITRMYWEPLTATDSITLLAASTANKRPFSMSTAKLRILLDDNPTRHASISVD